MRIISGKSRGTKLFTLDGLDTRPTLDRVKESLFNIINNKIQDATVLDLFSGSGAIGLEFASRGAKKVYLCDNSKKAMEIIKKNIDKTHLEDFVKTYNCDFKETLEKLNNEKIDIIYIDPPYKTDYIKQSIKILNTADYINKDTLIICETDELERIINEIKDLNIKITDKRKYGRVNLIFLNKD